MVQICCCLVLRVRLQKRSGGQSEEAPPVPIPNTEVKLLSVDNTWRATAREDRTLPERGLRTRRKLRPWICIYRGKLGYNTKKAHNSIYSSIAQSVEHAAVNRRVVGSSPTWGANQDTVWFYHTVSWFIKTKGLEPVRSRRLQERERNEARLDKPSMQRALTRDSLHNLRWQKSTSYDVFFRFLIFRLVRNCVSSIEIAPHCQL